MVVSCSRFQVSSLASLTLLWLTSSTLLHFGKTSKLAFRSAFATPGRESELSLLSPCATFRWPDGCLRFAHCILFLFYMA